MSRITRNKARNMFLLCWLASIALRLASAWPTVALARSSENTAAVAGRDRTPPTTPTNLRVTAKTSYNVSAPPPSRCKCLAFASDGVMH